MRRYVLLFLCGVLFPLTSAQAGGSWEPLTPFTLAALAQTEGEEGDWFHDERWQENANSVALKFGALWGTDDLHELDEIFYVEFAYVRYLVERYFALEFNIGFAHEDEDVGIVDIDVIAVPFFLNGRLGLPIGRLEPYVGAGIGGFFVHAELEAGVLDRKDDDIVFAGNLYAGINLNLTDTLFLGTEVKHIITDRSSDFGFDGTGITWTGNLGFRF